jgi:DNA-directed RNA polymerase specialized sigma24 family protein
MTTACSTLPHHDRSTASDARRARFATSTTARLDEEWRRLCGDQAVAARLRLRPLVGHSSLASLLIATGYDRSADPEAADRVVGELVRLAPGEPLAARVVLQRLLGPLVAVSVRRTRTHPADRESLLDDLVATAWEVIMSFPIDRRPVRVAGNLCRDIEYRCCSAPTRRAHEKRRAPLAAAQDTAVDSTGRPDVHAIDQLSELLLEIGAQHLAPGERLLLGAVLSDEPLQDIARHLDCAPRTLRWRKRRLVESLRERAAA